jgi:hypothetical protein
MAAAGPTRWWWLGRLTQHTSCICFGTGKAESMVEGFTGYSHRQLDQAGLLEAMRQAGGC